MASIGERIAAAGQALPRPPHTPLAGAEPGSFANATITSRLPAILAGLLRDMGDDLQRKHAGDPSALSQVDAALAEVSALRQAMLGDAELPHLQVEGAAGQCQVLLDAANACLAHGASQLPPGARASWLGLPWLLVECYMYVAIHAALQRRPALEQYDPFTVQKAAGWGKSLPAAVSMAGQVEALLRDLEHARCGSAPEPPQQQQQLVGAGVGAGPSGEGSAAAAAALAVHTEVLAALQLALWGNQTDLSLLVDAAALDAAGHAMVAAAAAGSQAAAAAAAAAQERIIVNDSAAVWRLMEQLRARAGAASGAPQRRVDVVLDNSGLELFADLCLADVLLEAGIADHVVLHGKQIAWFVSDTLESDLQLLLASCSQEAEAAVAEAAAAGAQLPSEAWPAVQRLAARWRGHLAAGRWLWAAHPFWTSPAPFCWMGQVAPDLHAELARSGLVIFKGDLNYRKLTHDCRWPHTAPFRESLQGFGPAPLLALRTCKADVVAGLAEGQSGRLTEQDPSWLVNGKWGMIQFA